MIGELPTLVLVRLEWGILIYFLAVNSFYALLLLSAATELVHHIRLTRHESRWRILSSDIAPRISLLAPAHNEEATIVDSVSAFLGLYYPSLEIVVVNDGSRDSTLGQLVSAFDLVPVESIAETALSTRPIRGIYRSQRHPGLVVVDKENGGKADALNCGLNIASGELVCAMDADTLVEPEALQRMIRPFLTSSDVLAVGGTIRVANGCVVSRGRVQEVRAPRQHLAGFQVIEYLRAFLFGRLGWNRLGGNLIVSGAFGLFRRADVLDAGGYLHDTVGEDVELVLRLRRQSIEQGGPSRVRFVPDPVSWTEVPESIRVLRRQRDRWHRGLADTLWRHRRLLFNPRYGVLGMLVLPYFLLIELLAPLVEVIGLAGLLAGLALGALNVPFALLFFVVAYGYGIVLGIATLVLEEVAYHRFHTIRDRLRVIAWAVAENLGYRQLTVVWRTEGLVRFLMGRKEWGRMERTGRIGTSSSG